MLSRFCYTKGHLYRSNSLSLSPSSIPPLSFSAARLELNNTSKAIAGLLSKPLCDVVHRLRELRASQEKKVDTCSNEIEEVCGG